MHRVSVWVCVCVCAVCVRYITPPRSFPAPPTPINTISSHTVYLAAIDERVSRGAGNPVVWFWGRTRAAAWVSVSAWLGLGWRGNRGRNTGLEQGLQWNADHMAQAFSLLLSLSIEYCPPTTQTHKHTHTYTHTHTGFPALSPAISLTYAGSSLLPVCRECNPNRSRPTMARICASLGLPWWPRWDGWWWPHWLGMSVCVFVCVCVCVVMCVCVCVCVCVQSVRQSVR